MQASFPSAPVFRRRVCFAACLDDDQGMWQKVARMLAELSGRLNGSSGPKSLFDKHFELKSEHLLLIRLGFLPGREIRDHPKARGRNVLR